MSNFRFINYNEQYLPILQRVLDNPNDWGEVAKFENIGGILKPYGFLPLIMAVVSLPNLDPKKSEFQITTPMFEKYIEVREWWKSRNINMISQFGKATGRAAFFRLRVGGGVNRHIDDGTYYLSRDRYHLALQGEYLYTVDDESHIIRPGTFFWFDNKKYHSAQNISNVERITLVFDVLKSSSNP